MGRDESRFNFSVGSDGQSHKTVSTNRNLFEEKGEPKRYRTEVLPLTSLTNALPLGQTGSQSSIWFSVALRPQRRVGLLGTGTEWEGDERVKGSTAETA